MIFNERTDVFATLDDAEDDGSDTGDKDLSWAGGEGGDEEEEFGLKEKHSGGNYGYADGDDDENFYSLTDDGEYNDY